MQLGREHPPLLHPPLQGHALIRDPVTTKLSRLIPPRKKEELGEIEPERAQLIFAELTAALMQLF